ncbi:MAG: transcriptional regulator [Deltaproteobacteria bacterium]|nr:MAG: transcriptional regulator [Deltaproteobacteria bacterium]
MTFVFGPFELDPARRELRVEGEPQSIQPQVFDLLLYLVENHERVVPKRELLEALWPDTIVTESSIQRAVSLARSALGERGPELIQTFPRQGYRFVGDRRAEKKVAERRPQASLCAKRRRSHRVHDVGRRRHRHRRREWMDLAHARDVPTSADSGIHGSAGENRTGHHVRQTRDRSF